MIPRDAREVYRNDRGEAVAYCPRDGLALVDVLRHQLVYAPNQARLLEMADRAAAKTDPGGPWCAICIDVDDPVWRDLVDHLMPGHDWDAYRKLGQQPFARGVVPTGLMRGMVDHLYPAALPELDRVAALGPPIVVCGLGGASIYGRTP